MVPGEGGEHCLMVRICGGGEDDGEDVDGATDDYLE